MNPVDQAERQIMRGGRVHLIGVGGIGMAGLAYLLMKRGLTVSGCDLAGNRQTAWLQKSGVEIDIGHDAGHISPETDWVIRSTAVPSSHPEVVRADELGIPVSRRGEVLPALMRDRTCIAVAGTHGKTTTTAMIAQVLQCGYCIGGEMTGIEGVAHDAPLMVVEADESDGTIAGYTPDYTVITNVEYDHMEHHASESAFIDCFRQLVDNTFRQVVYRGDDPILQTVIQSAVDSGQEFEPFYYPVSSIPLSVPGRHSQWNAAAAMAVCRNWMSEKRIVEALRSFQPVRRRLETVYHDRGIRIISDYAHHPTEIASLVQSVREIHEGRLLAVFQPHRYTRTRALGSAFPSSFEGIDHLWLIPVYAASEEPIKGGSTEDLIAHFPESWSGRLCSTTTMDDAWNHIEHELREGDMLLIIGAGDIGELAERVRG